jgi:iron complex outermembrane receptor protein
MLSLFIWIFFINLSAQNESQEFNSDSLKFELEQITISATRYPEKLLEVPYAISVLAENRFSNIRGYGLDEALNSVPGILAQSRAGSQDVRLVIRGFGARGAGDRSNSGTSRGIKIMVDGFSETEPDGRTSFDLIDLQTAEMVEVIRSNSSALYGNAAGGVINIITDPGLISSYFSIRGAAASFGFSQYSLEAGTAIGSGKIYGSFINNTFNGWRKHSSSSRSLINIGLISNFSERTILGVHLTGSSSVFHIPGPLTKSQFDNDPSSANSVYEARDERRFNRLGRLGFSLEHKLNNSHYVSSSIYINPKYLQRSERGTFRDFTRYHLGGNILYHNTFPIDQSLSNHLIIGIDEAYQDGAVLFYSLSPSNQRGDILDSDKREGANNFGLFFQDELIIDERISVIAGLRYDDVTYYSEDFLAPEFGLQKKSFKKVTPKLGITYMISQVQSIYANLGGGIEVPAGNETDPAGTFGQDSVFLLNPLLEPIKSTTYEIGIKHMVYSGTSFLQSFIYDAAFYFIDVRNDVIPYREGRFYFTAGKTRRIGIELSSNFQFYHGIHLDGTFTFSDNKYINYFIDSVHYGNPGKSADYGGNKAAGIPDLFYFAGVTYSPEFFSWIYLNLNMNGSGKYYADDANAIEIPSFTVFSASIGLTKEVPLAAGFFVKGFFTVNNIYDKKYAASAFINPGFINGEAIYLEPGLPRSIVLSLTVGVK